MSKLLFKKSINTVVFIMLIIAPTIIWGQSDSLVRTYQSPCQSEWTEYNFTDQNSIVRSNNQNHVTYIHEKTNRGYRRHIFVVRNNSMIPVAAFSTLFVDCCQNCFCPTVTISDMRLFNRTCYFCGKWVSPMSIINHDPITKGFIGHFRIDDMLTGTGSVFYMIIDTVSQLSRLAISPYIGSSVLISAIGNTKVTHRDCILEMNDLNHEWKMRYDTLFNNQKIVFSDIMAMGDSLTLLSQYKCDNDNLPGSNDYDNCHQVFMLDRFDKRGCYYTCNPPGFHDMAFYVMQPTENCYFHYNKTPMRLLHINNYNNEFGVAFGVEEADGNDGGIRLFPFKHAWKYDSCIYYRTGVHTKIQDIGNLYNTNNLFVLSQSSTHTNGMISVPLLGSASHDVTWLTNSFNTYESLTQKIGGNHIDISGHNGSYDFILFDQNINSLPLESCFTKTVYQYEVLPARSATRNNMEWESLEKEVKIQWVKAETTTLNLDLDVICNFCSDQQ